MRRSHTNSFSSGEDEEEYETADSGVSEQSSTSSSSDNLTTERGSKAVVVTMPKSF